MYSYDSGEVGNSDSNVSSEVSLSPGVRVESSAVTSLEVVEAAALVVFTCAEELAEAYNEDSASTLETYESEKMISYYGKSMRSPTS